MLIELGVDLPRGTLALGRDIQTPRLHPCGVSDLRAGQMACLEVPPPRQDPPTATVANTRVVLLWLRYERRH
jgi:hypothetical protein